MNRGPDNIRHQAISSKTEYILISVTKDTLVVVTCSQDCIKYISTWLIINFILFLFNCGLWCPCYLRLNRYKLVFPAEALISITRVFFPLGISESNMHYLPAPFRKIHLNHPYINLLHYFFGCITDHQYPFDTSVYPIRRLIWYGHTIAYRWIHAIQFPYFPVRQHYGGSRMIGTISEKWSWRILVKPACIIIKTQRNANPLLYFVKTLLTTN